MASKMDFQDFQAIEGSDLGYLCRNFDLQTFDFWKNRFGIFAGNPLIEQAQIEGNFMNRKDIIANRNQKEK